MMYREGCHVTVGEGASAGTRWSGMPVSVAHCNAVLINEVKYKRSDQTYNINVRSCIGYGEIFAVMREA